MIVYTIGCFDLLHVGHIRFLKKSKELGSFLIVGVHPDSTIFSYKRRYPVIPFEQRIEMLQAIRYVDKVVKTESLTDVNFVTKYNVDIVTAVPSWFSYEHNRNRRKQIEALGASMVVIPYTEEIIVSHTEGISTTKLIEKIKKNET